MKPIETGRWLRTATAERFRMVVADRRTIVVFGVIMSLATGCGGSSGGSSPTSPSAGAGAAHGSPAVSATASAQSTQGTQNTQGTQGRAQSDCGSWGTQDNGGPAPRLKASAGVDCSTARTVMTAYAKKINGYAPVAVTVQGWNCSSNVFDNPQTVARLTCAKGGDTIELTAQPAGPSGPP